MTAPEAAFEVVVVGAGLAGASAAVVLGRQGRRVALVDPRPTYPPAFKAEKIEPDQAEVLRSLGLMDGILPHAARIHTIVEGHRGRVVRVVSLEQYGIFYQDMVNAVQRQLPATVERRTARAVAVLTGPEVQTVVLDTGERLPTRLAVLAGGTGGRLHEDLGITRRVVRAPHSLCSGWDVVRTDGTPFPFDSLTYWADSLDDGIDYVTFFLIPGRMRINLFSYRGAKDPWVRALAEAPHAVLARAMPRHLRLAGEWRASSKVESRPIDLYVATPPARDGMVLLGDSFQSVCPATGTGLNKVLTDVERLCRTHLPAWLATPGMGSGKIASYYTDPVKVDCDRRSLQLAEDRRRFSTDRSLRWWIHRRKSDVLMTLQGWREGRRR